MNLTKDSFCLWNCLLQVFLLTEFLSVTLCKDNDDALHLRNVRSIKDALPKDDEFSQSKAITNMRHKIFNLESSVKNINLEIEKISDQNNNLQESVNQQKSLIENLNAALVLLQGTLSGHAETLGDLEKLSSSDENLFALSNQTCGGVLVSQSGSIVFTSQALRGMRYPSTCIWTIRANNRGTIKITTNAYRGYAYTRPNAYVVEIFEKNDTNVTTSINSPSNLQTKITRLERNMHRIFKGPIVFIVYVLTSHINDDYAEIDLHLNYEGLGKLTQKTTFFSHESLQENTGNFTSNQIENWKASPITGNRGSENATYVLDYTTIVISNFSTKVHLEAIFENGRCGDRDTSFIVITDLMESNVAFIDCCQHDCNGKNSLINYDSPFIILITKKFVVPLKFNLSWEAETPYPSSSKLEPGNPYGHKCGEVLGGSTGSILYKPHVSYRNGERCIWTIVPQPRPRSSIVINVGANGVENVYDHLYMMELTDVNGTALADAPKITRLGRYGTYEANSREVYVVFYSDSSVTGYGFSLSWRSTGDIVKSGRDVTTKFTILKGDNGFATSLMERPSLTSSVYQVFLLTPIVPFAYTFGLQLHINQTHPTPTDCLHEDISVFTALDGVLSRPDMTEICNSDLSEPGRVVIENADGMAMIVLNEREANPHVAVNFSWREEYGKGNASYVSVENNDCGGVIKGDKGVLKYKIGTDYLNNERCVWLLQTPNHTSITLKLLKDGFETCCDNLLVNTIEPLNGTLRNDTTIINRQNRTQTFNESVLVIVFRSDTSTRGRGFALQFSGSGETKESPKYRFQLRHHNEPFGGVTFPSSEWEDSIPGTNDIFVIGSSLKIGIDEDPLTMPTNISWTSGVFRKESGENICNYESITFYTTPDPSGWLQRERFPNENETESCPNEVRVGEKNDICNTVYSAFLAIYRHLPLSTEETPDDSDGDLLKMGFTFEKSAGCGGVLIGERGEISYKENGKYSNGEKCIWLVQAPQASKIRFYLSRSGFEACCDLLYIHTINQEGSAVPAAVIQEGNRSAIVDGPVAIVVFTSDSSVTGEGFRLNFYTETNISEPFPYTYSLKHANQPKQNQFIFQVEENEVVIAAFSPELHRQTYQGIGKTQINVVSLRPQIDESCESDRLTFYDVFGSDRGLVASKYFRLGDVLDEKEPEPWMEPNHSAEPGHCTALENQVFKNCNNILDCGDAPKDNVFSLNSTSFVAIYKSANVTGNLSYRGFVMISTTSYLQPVGSSS